MNSDRYLKGVLTVIAASLVAIVLQNAVRPVRAQDTEPQKVQICDSLGACLGLLPHTDFGIKSWVLPVSVQELPMSTPQLLPQQP